MPLLRLLSASLFASAFILQAAAQTPVASPTQTQTPQIITTQKTFVISVPPVATSFPLLLTSKPTQFQFKIPQVPPTTLLAQTHGLCYTMRSYGFTTQDLQSPTPRPSSHTDCSPESSVHFKELQGLVAK